MSNPSSTIGSEAGGVENANIESKEEQERMERQYVRFDARCCWITLLTLNTIFAIFGFCVVVVTFIIDMDHWAFLMMSRAANQKFDRDPMDVPSLLEDAKVVLMAGGIVMVVSAGLGIGATIKRDRKLLFAYAMILVASSTLQFIAGVLCTIYKDRFVKEAFDYMDVSLQVRYRGPFYNVTNFEGDLQYSQAFDFGQVTLGCCGVKNGTDYARFSLWGRRWMFENATWTSRVPFTCCFLDVDVGDIERADLTTLSSKLMDPTCPLRPTPENSYARIGCYDRLIDIYNYLITIILAVGNTMVALEVTAWVISFRFARFLQRTFSDFDIW